MVFDGPYGDMSPFSLGSLEQPRGYSLPYATGPGSRAVGGGWWSRIPYAAVLWLQRSPIHDVDALLKSTWWYCRRLVIKVYVSGRSMITCSSLALPTIVTLAHIVAVAVPEASDMRRFYGFRSHRGFAQPYFLRNDLYIHIYIYTYLGLKPMPPLRTKEP